MLRLAPTTTYLILATTILRFPITIFTLRRRHLSECRVSTSPSSSSLSLNPCQNHCRRHHRHPHLKPEAMVPGAAEDFGEGCMRRKLTSGTTSRTTLTAWRPTLSSSSTASAASRSTSSRDVVEMLRENGKVCSRLLQKVSTRVLKWYQDDDGNLHTKEVVCEVVEGNVFNVGAGKEALRNLSALGLFYDLEVLPVPDEKNVGGVVVDINLKEQEHETADVTTEWNIVRGHGGYPTLASLIPGGAVTYQLRNINGLNRSLIGS